jgi:uncharacterized repeat protein (TIGR03843 family)
MPTEDFKPVLECLEKGKLTLEGHFLWGSNYTFLLKVEYGQLEELCVYKPTRGERPLWDFPSESLAGREVAAFLVSETLNLHFVPPTVYRGDGPAGPGSLQHFINHDPEYHYFTLIPKDRERMKSVAFFDLIINNADRKGGHILFDENDKLWLIDHGISFHTQNKLRTVIWDFADQPIPPELLSKIPPFLDQLEPGTPFYQALVHYLSPREIKALSMRAKEVISHRLFPSPKDDVRSYPWPPV